MCFIFKQLQEDVVVFLLVVEAEGVAEVEEEEGDDNRKDLDNRLAYAQIKLLLIKVA